MVENNTKTPPAQNHTKHTKKQRLAMGQSPVPPPVNIPISTKIGSEMGGEFTYPKWDPLGFEPWPFKSPGLQWQAKRLHLSAAAFDVSGGRGEDVARGADAEGGPQVRLQLRPGRLQQRPLHLPGEKNTAGSFFFPPPFFLIFWSQFF